MSALIRLIIGGIIGSFTRKGDQADPTIKEKEKWKEKEKKEKEEWKDLNEKREKPESATDREHLPGTSFRPPKPGLGQHPEPF